MKCERCQGRGRIVTAKGRWRTYDCDVEYEASEPCPDCNGSGQAHCCDGLREQPCADPPGK